MLCFALERVIVGNTLTEFKSKKVSKVGNKFQKILETGWGRGASMYIPFTGPPGSATLLFSHILPFSVVHATMLTRTTRPLLCSRIWDLPTGRMVDWMSFKKAVTGVTVSPTGEFMCTSHQGRVGLSVWADQR